MLITLSAVSHRRPGSGRRCARQRADLGVADRDARDEVVSLDLHQLGIAPREARLGQFTVVGATPTSPRATRSRSSSASTSSHVRWSWGTDEQDADAARLEVGQEVEDVDSGRDVEHGDDLVRDEQVDAKQERAPRGGVSLVEPEPAPAGWHPIRDVHARRMVDT
jgi:hypothetical protein